MPVPATPTEPDAPSQQDQQRPASGSSAREELDGWLRDAFRGGRKVPFQARLRAECFILGGLCARTGRPSPAWLNDAPLWAHGAALNGYRAYVRARPAAGADAATPVASAPGQPAEGATA
jgi:hypothetical protein